MKPYAESFYNSHAWKDCRRAYSKSVGGLCERCLQRGIYSPGEIVHHKVHITPEKAYMEYSSCENQDCVGQGEITMDNYKTRILSTFVICLPNNVTVEMVPVE